MDNLFQVWCKVDDFKCYIGVSSHDTTSSVIRNKLLYGFFSNIVESEHKGRKHHVEVCFLQHLCVYLSQRLRQRNDGCQVRKSIMQSVWKHMIILVHKI